MGCQTIATGTGFGNECLAWVQNQEGLQHVGNTAYDAWTGAYANARTGSPQNGDLVFFSPAPINGGDGHVGIYNGGGSFTSVLSDGNAYSCDIATFNAQNGTQTLGYVSIAALTGNPGTTNPIASAGNAVSSTLRTVSQGGANWGRYALWGLLGLVGLYALDSGTNALADLA